MDIQVIFLTFASSTWISFSYSSYKHLASIFAYSIVYAVDFLEDYLDSDIIMHHTLVNVT